MLVPNYTYIDHNVQRELGLTLLEYCVLDKINHLSSINNEKSGWCYASKSTLAKMLGVSARTIFHLLRKLEQEGLIIKDPQTKYLKTTEKWDKATFDGSLIIRNHMKIKHSNDE